jgi:MFS family permease
MPTIETGTAQRAISFEGKETSATKVPLLMGLLMATGLVMDLQGVGMSPLIGVITKELAMSITEITWVVNALLIGGAVGVGLTSRLGDIGGHRRVLLILSICGLIGSLLAATAVNAWMLGIGRFTQGFAVATPLAWGLLRPLATKNQIQLSASLLSLVICIFTPVSLVMGGLLLYFGYGWQGIFWILSVAYALVIVLTIISPETPEASRSNDPLDIVGAMGLGVWLTAFLLGISLTNKYGFMTPMPLTLFATSLVLLIAWIVQQRRNANPLMDFRGVDIRQMLGGYVGLASTAIPTNSLFILLPAMLVGKPELGHGFGLSTFEASLPLLGILPGAYIAPMMLRKALNTLGPRACMMASGLICAVSFIAFAFFTTQLWLAYLWVVVYGFGVVGCFTTGWALIASCARADNTAIIIAGMTAAQKIVGSVTVALVIISLNPAAGPAPTGVFAMCFLGVSISVFVAYVLLSMVAVPRQLTDRHAADAI